MRRDSRLSVALHVLLHMQTGGDPITSEELAGRLRMNAVVLRRMLSALGAAKIVRGDKGHGGGWALARDLAEVSLGDVMTALGPTTLFAIGPRNDETECPIEQAVDRTVGGVLAEAEELILERFRAVSVASLVARARHKLTKEIPNHA